MYVVTVNPRSPEKDSIASPPTACYSRQTWQRPWARVDNCNCLHQLTSYMCCVSTSENFQRRAAAGYQDDHITKEKKQKKKKLACLNRISWVVIKKYDDSVENSRLVGEGSLSLFGHLGHVCQWSPLVVEPTEQHALTDRHILSKCHGYTWTFSPPRDEFILSHSGKWLFSSCSCS